MGSGYNMIIAYVAGIIFLFILARLLLVPAKLILRLIYNALLGAVGIIVLNLVGSLFGFHLPLNIISAFVVGFMGIPGLLLIIVLRVLIGV
jgi:inhibitor of the pro-sigma K processing machinery